MLTDIVLVVLWCFAVYVCVFDWEDVKNRENFPGSCRRIRSHKRR